MKKILTTIGATVFLLGCSTLTQEQNNPNVTKNIEGVWIINNADSPKHFSNGYYKVICSDQHRVIRIKDGVLQGIHGGYVSFDGQVMVEKPRFLKTGNGFLGKTFKFNVKPDGSSFLQTGIKGSGSFENLKQQWVKVGSANHNIEGVWMMNLNNGHVRIKMIVDNFWNWIVVDPKTNNVTAALGGSYDYDGKNYVETTHFKFGGTEKWELGRKWQVVAELKDGNLLFHGKNDGGNDFTENWVKYGATSILSQKQDAPAALEQNKQAADASFEQRMKQARKPYNFINVSYMDVKDGMEEEYLKVESAWKKIHEKLASEGKIISWGLAKARKNEFGYEYITWVILRSRGALDKLYDMKALKAWMGEDKMDDLMAKTIETRSITGGELLTLEDYTLVSLDPPNEVVDSKNFFFHWNFMTPTKGKAQDYVNTEKNAFQPRHQKKSELNPRFQWWNLQKQILSWGSVNKAPYRTVDFFRNDVAQPSDKELEKINAQMPAFPEGLTYQNIMEMREMKRVTFDVVHLIDRSMSAETKAWETLIGTWTAPSATQWEKGAYRRKTITPYTEVFELFDAEGKVIDRQKKPLSIEVINGINYFTIYPPNNEASFPFKIVDGKWYENMRGMLSNNSEKPDQFLVYKKTDQPVFSDKSSFTKKGEDVELVKAIIENYAAGKIDDYLALFTKDAKVTHNNNEPITISELAKIHRVHHEQIAGPVKILSSNYEVVATANGNKYGHAWVKFENTYKNGSKAVTPVFVSFGINNKGKVYFEHALYDTATVPDDSVYSEN